MPPEAEWPLDDDLARLLLRRYAPQWADLPLGRRYEGWDTVTWRLGDSHAIRLPRLTAALDLLRREQTWLPRLAVDWSFEGPGPVHVSDGVPEFPRPWSVLRWVDGEDVATSPLVRSAAVPLAEVLRAVHRPAPADAPDTPWRTAPLAEREDELRQALTVLGRRDDVDHLRLDRPRADEIWSAGAVLPPVTGVWVHADLHARNVVARGGALVGVLDWGEVCAGDPAIDLAMAWELLPDPGSVARCLDAYGQVDSTTLARARAHALLACAVHAAGDDPLLAAAGVRGLSSLGVWGLPARPPGELPDGDGGPT